MVASIEHQERIAELRQKARAGVLTLDECKEAIEFLRAERLLMPATKASGKSKEPAPDVGGMLNELGIG